MMDASCFCLLQLMDALAELPADLLLFHVCLPLTLPYLNIRFAADLLCGDSRSGNLCLTVHGPVVTTCGRVAHDIYASHACCRAVVRRGVQWWLAQAAALLDLEDYLLRRPGLPAQAQVPFAMRPAPTTSGTYAEWLPVEVPTPLLQAASGCS